MHFSWTAFVLIEGPFILGTPAVLAHPVGAKTWRLTLVLFRTRRWDECSRLKEGVWRRVRKSRQKEAAGAVDAGVMQIEWSERWV